LLDRSPEPVRYLGITKDNLDWLVLLEEDLALLNVVILIPLAVHVDARSFAGCCHVRLLPLVLVEDFCVFFFVTFHESHFNTTRVICLRLILGLLSKFFISSFSLLLQLKARFSKDDSVKIGSLF